MTQLQIIEQIQQVHPEIGESQLTIMLNNALDEFVSEARTNEKLGVLTPVADQRYYDFSDLDSVNDDGDVLEVMQVSYFDSSESEELIIDKFIGEPQPQDRS